jgi:solute carrier family 25 (mitochondrial 2-oxodicarboxylate transporter), member 21
MPILTYKFCLQEGRALPKTISGFYRGIGVQASTVAPITAIQFLFNGMLQDAILKSRHGASNTNKDLSDVEMIAAAAGAGAMSAVVYSPVDLLTIQQQKLGLDSVGKTIQSLVGSYGVRGLYRGFWSCVGRESLYTAGYLGLAPVITSRLVQDVPSLQDKPLAASIIGACTAGTLAAITTHPVSYDHLCAMFPIFRFCFRIFDQKCRYTFLSYCSPPLDAIFVKIDTAKTCLQSDMNGSTWSTTIGTMQKLMREGGVVSLYRGMIPRTVRLCGAFFICLMVRDAAIEWKTRSSHMNGGDNHLNAIQDHKIPEQRSIVVATASSERNR